MAPLTPIALLCERPVDEAVTVRAALVGLQPKRTVSGQDWATLRLQDGGIAVTVLVFPKDLRGHREGRAPTGHGLAG